jgi:hypothetical protein
MLKFIHIFLLSLVPIPTLAFSNTDIFAKSNIHITGPMRGSFAVYCEIPPGLIYKRGVVDEERTVVSGPAMRGSFVFYGCCPGRGGGPGIAEISEVSFIVILA